MKSLFRHIVIVFLLISLASCDVASSLLTKNHFEQFGSSPFSFLVNQDSWNGLSQTEKLAKIEEYTDIALSDDGDELFSAFSELPSYRDAVTAFYRSAVIDGTAVKPVIGTDTYLEDLSTYQRHTMALGKIEVYARSSNAVDGFNNLYMSYFSGEQEDPLDKDVFIKEVFGEDDLIEDGKSSTEIRIDLDSDLIGAYYAGEAFNKLGETITNIDNPLAEVVTEADAVIILLSCLIYRIIDLSIAGDPIPTDINNPVFIELRDYILDDDPLTSVVFPQDDVTFIGEIDTMLEHYLGIGGALIYSATGYELPPITVLEGGV